ncbi:MULTISPECIES: preprotein translocase subunit SecE [unclassified Gemella]|uniref:preprotein translocase subunit SecE n=1 Tax=unclassified Gemella TaxID=2624949 RepID=UPI0010731B56|nr:MULTISPECIES: preprotein translocase subunit SecE [unclassified Gemella]MBF0710056.1 preprotein translocase subunit SecE [Gemella sp. GL1.1]MBF0746135.1 preprotein translocase subunit SecE [Gemella sp. 19428wG2_WT2a]NYS27400.1 preprotein translocase subunit SecE [Gemella sp. GL1]TFU60423.1 preprotein translocase subunit SecE [Gemella sp. WT2a]
MFSFFKGVVSEMKKVSWPTFPELVKKTSIVIFTMILLMLFIYIVDLGISTLIRNIK